MSNRRALAILVLASSLVAVGTPVGGIQSSAQAAGGDLQAPSTANPYLAFLPPGATADYERWKTFLNPTLRARSGSLAVPPRRPGLRITEQEPRDQTGFNDTAATADFIAGFGTGQDDVPVADIVGTAPPTPVGNTFTVNPAESDDAISQATDTLIAFAGDLATASAAVGDGDGGSAGSGTGDFDFYKIPAVSAGAVMFVEIHTAIPVGEEDLDPSLALWDSDGNLLAFNEDISPEDWDSRVAFRAAAAGDYYASVGGFGSFYPDDPTDPDSPGITGTFGSEGDYDVSVQLLVGDIDVFRVSLEAGDIIGASAAGSPYLVSLIGPDGIERIGSGQNATLIHPVTSPFFANPDPVALSYVIDQTADYYVAVHTVGRYQAHLEVYRPAKERSTRGTQVLFVDFDGITLDLGEFSFGFPRGTITTLSPLSSFLSRWGLSPSDEDAVIDAILEEVEENLSEDLRAVGSNGDFDVSGQPGDFDIEIRNSRDHADPWGKPFASRIIVGGTIEELMIETIGIAESIDVGDFDSEETGFVLLDFLSAPPGDPLFEPISLNAIPKHPSANIIDLIGVAVGNIVAHEAGHFFANWHTEVFDSQFNIQDQAGNFAGMFGLGRDGIFGTADDIDVDFGPGAYASNEGFSGIEDTLESIAFGLSTGTGRRTR